VQLQEIPQGIAITVSCDGARSSKEVGEDGHALMAFLNMTFPSHRVSFQTWHPIDAF
jgi:hypothetical protein